MIGSITSHISKGVTNIENNALKMTWFKTNFNMPVPNYFYDTGASDWVRTQGCWTYNTETTNYDLSGFVPGYEICNGATIFDFDNTGSGTPYNVDTDLYCRWTDPSLNTLYWNANPYHFTYTVPAWDWYNYAIVGNIGCAGWEITSNDTYHFRASAVGDPTIAVSDTSVTITNCPSTARLGAGKEGYIWVEGNNLCYITGGVSGDPYEWKHTMVGVDQGDTGSTNNKGYIWLNGTLLEWVGSDGHKYSAAWAVQQFASIYSNGATGSVDAGVGNYGYLWVDNLFGGTHMAYIGSDGYKWLTGAGDNPYA